MVETETKLINPKAGNVLEGKIIYLFSKYPKCKSKYLIEK